MSFRIITLLFIMSALAACNDGADNTKTNISPSDLDFLFIQGDSIIAGKAGNKISVDASHSYSTAHSPLHFQWSVKSQPANSSITISDDATATPSFTPIQVGIYELSLLLTDNNKEKQSTTFTIFITGMGTNAIPIAIAGSDQHVKIGSLTHLDATHSNDADSDTLTYLWSIVKKPSKSTVSLSNNTAAQPQFTPDIAGSYVFSLIVNDANDDSTNVARTTITVTPAHHNSIPIANAGIDQTLQPHHQVSLSGQSSHDNDGEALTYLWRITSKPANSSPTLSGPTNIHPTFSATVSGAYQVQLVVNDGTDNSIPDTLTINVATSSGGGHSTSALQQLMSFGLDSTDAHYLVANHASEVTAVLAQTDKIFEGVTISDSMFKDGTDSAAAGFTDPQIIPWTSAYKTRFKKIFGRIKFAVNTSHFETAFTSQYSALVSNTHQGDQNFWLPYPANFTGYKADFVTTITTNAKAFKFFISDRASGSAYGGKPLKLKMESKMMRDQTPAQGARVSPTPINDTASLLYHELNHSIGYDHGAANQNDVILKPNNIPYFVQIILGYNADDIVGTYCAGDQFTCSYHLTWGNPTSILTTLFGKS